MCYVKICAWYVIPNSDRQSKTWGVTTNTWWFVCIRRIRTIKYSLHCPITWSLYQSITSSALRRVLKKRFGSSPTIIKLLVLHLDHTQFLLSPKWNILIDIQPVANPAILLRMWTNMSRVGALWRLCFPAATGSNRLEWIMSIFIVIVCLSEHGQRLHRIGPLYRPGLLLPLGYTSNDNNETWCKYHNTRFRKYQLVWQLSYFKLSVGIIWKLGFQMCFCNHWNLSCWKNILVSVKIVKHYEWNVLIYIFYARYRLKSYIGTVVDKVIRNATFGWSKFPLYNNRIVLSSYTFQNVQKWKYFCFSCHTWLRKQKIKLCYTAIYKWYMLIWVATVFDYMTQWNYISMVTMATTL